MNNYSVIQKGQFWVLQNYVRANQWYSCDESVTLTTIGDPSLLENLKTLVEHWNGPVSVALYTPGTDMELALRLIKYLRMCYPLLITEYVSFHFFFESDHIPQNISLAESAQSINSESYPCTSSPWPSADNKQLYRTQKGLKFPINVGRNIARDAATTHFILASDIELYPSRNVISNFLNMIQQNPQHLQTTTPSVFVLPPFEVEERALVPSTKQNLVSKIQALGIKKTLVLHSYARRAGLHVT